MNANDISPKANLRMRRIQKISKLARAFLMAGLIVQVLAMTAGVLVLPFVPHGMDMTRSPAAFKSCSVLLALPFGFMVTLHFFRFFSRLKDGRLFENQTVRQLEMAGKWWMLLGLVQIVIQFVEACIFSPDNIIVSLSGNGMGAGLVVFFIAWLFGEAQKLQEEQELTV